jgi:hypothetical protein
MLSGISYLHHVLSLPYLLAAPFILVTLIIEKNQSLNLKNKRGILILLDFIWIFFFLAPCGFFGAEIITGSFIKIWLEFLLPFTIILYLIIREYPSQHNEEVKETKNNYCGLSKKTIIVFGLTVVVSLAFVVFDYIKSPSIVLDHHKQLFTRLSESKDPQLILDVETMKPSYSAPNIPIQDIKEIKNGEVEVDLATPWSISLIVKSKATGDLKYWWIEYVRVPNWKYLYDNTVWRLEEVR